ncbi:MAG: ATP-dependent DNA helicase RecG [Terriglobales bacterium]
MLELNTPVQYVKGVGPRIAAILTEKGVSTVEDLLYYLPFRYEDRLNPRSIAELRPGEMATVIGEVRTSGLFRTSRMPIFEMNVAQGRNALKCVWFNATYLKGKFEPGQIVALYGKVEETLYGRSRIQLVQPQFEILGEPGEVEAGAAASLEMGRIVPIYESAGRGKLTSRWFRRIIDSAMKNLAAEVPDGVPAAICRRLQLPPRREAFLRAHWPPPEARLEELLTARTPAHRRLIFEELFFLEVGLELKRKRLRGQPGITFRLEDQVRAAVKRILPFHPTAAQKRVLGEIARDMSAASPMRRLLQGDVGSGKTIVALEAAIIAIENGHQAALMAPTEILATQHYLAARRILEKAAYRIVLLTGSLDTAQKREIRRHIAQGSAQLVIGTHALIEEKVEFANLGLVIVDEQHRFGVLQRFRLMKKPSAAEPDTLVMTATPIPRTLALTLYGDLDVSVLDEMPPGRVPIVTRRVGDERSEEVFAFVRKQVAAGHQAYIVYPVIEEKEEEDVARPPSAAPSGSEGKAAPITAALFPEAQPRLTLKAAVKMYDELRKRVFPDLRVGLLHGRLAADEKDDVMRRFAAGEIDVLVATTVIEVGVDVANATVMVVEHAERFGLAQLHQLRGRIGRGAAKSYCILMTGGKVSEDGEKRLDALVRTSDGFAIGEMDLQLRGPGEFFGTRQSGMPGFRVANLLRDIELLEVARREAGRVVAGPSAEITQEEIARVFAHLKSHWQRRYGLVEVG